MALSPVILVYPIAEIIEQVPRHPDLYPTPPDSRDF